VRLLLDTHTLLWTFEEPHKLSQAATAALADPGNSLTVSIASLWEITIKIAKGQLTVPGNSIEYILGLVDSSRINLLSLHSAHLLELQTLPRFHKDPFDRILIAQSRTEHIPLVTRDRDIRRYDVETIWK
jgi:PIN domain nuclease of toxin-antitoxin system